MVDVIIIIHLPASIPAVTQRSNRDANKRKHARTRPEIARNKTPRQKGHAEPKGPDSAEQHRDKANAISKPKRHKEALIAKQPQRQEPKGDALKRAQPYRNHLHFREVATTQRKTEAGTKSGAEPAETRGAPRRHKHQAVQPPRRTGEGGDRRPEVPLTQRHIT